MTNIFKPHVVRIDDKYAIRRFNFFCIFLIPVIGQIILLHEIFCDTPVIWKYYDSTTGSFSIRYPSELNCDHLFSSAEKCNEHYKSLFKSKKKKIKVKFVNIEKEVSIEKFQK